MSSKLFHTHPSFHIKKLTTFTADFWASDEILVPGTPSSGNYLAFSASKLSSVNSYAIMPALPAGEAASHLSFKYKFKNSEVGTLTYGVIDGTNSNSYTILGTISTPSNNPGTVDVDLDVSQTAGKRIAFRWQVTTESTYTCGIDDIYVVTPPLLGPFITLTPDAATVFTGSTETLTAIPSVSIQRK